MQIRNSILTGVILSLLAAGPALAQAGDADGGIGQTDDPPPNDAEVGQSDRPALPDDEDARPSDPPDVVVQKLQDALLEAMKNADSLGFEGRLDQLSPVVRETHDFEYAARVALKSHWADLEARERRDFVDLFTQLSIETYASKFNNYNGQTFTIVSTSEHDESKALVRTVLVKANGDKVHLDYLLRQSKSGQWRIANIVSDGVSDLALKQAEYDAVMNDSGFEGLIEELREQIERARTSET